MKVGVSGFFISGLGVACTMLNMNTQWKLCEQNQVVCKDDHIQWKLFSENVSVLTVSKIQILSEVDCNSAADE